MENAMVSENSGFDASAVEQHVEQGRNGDREVWQRFRAELEQKERELHELLGRMKAFVEQRCTALLTESWVPDEMAGKLEQSLRQSPNVIKLNVGGMVFATSLSTLTSVKGTFFDSMFSGRWPLHPEADGTIFIDRDPMAFYLVLQCLRGEIIDPTCIPAEKMAAFRRDVDYYGLPEEVADRCMGGKLWRMGAVVEKFSPDEHTCGVSLSENNCTASRGVGKGMIDSNGDSNEWVLGANTYSGQDHVVITLKIVRVGSFIMLGVVGRKPEREDSYCEPTNFAVASDCIYSGGEWSKAQSLPMHSGDIVEVDIDCKQSQLTVRNTTRYLTQSLDLPTNKQWRLHVHLYNSGSSVRITESRAVLR